MLLFQHVRVGSLRALQLLRLSVRACERTLNQSFFSSSLAVPVYTLRTVVCINSSHSSHLSPILIRYCV